MHSRSHPNSTTQRRFDPNFARVKRAILEGEVGNVVQVKLTSRDPSPPPFEYVKGGGGIFKVRTTVHTIRTWMAMCGTSNITSYAPSLRLIT